MRSRQVLCALLLAGLAAGLAAGCGQSDDSTKQLDSDGGPGESFSPSPLEPDAAPLADASTREDAVCQPLCTERSCGPDACGGSCGSCPDLHECNPQGQCIKTGCQRDCSGRQCGPDGCGGTCGQCTAQATCSAGSCVPKYPACLEHEDCPADEFCLADGADLGACTAACDLFAPQASCSQGSCNAILADPQAGAIWPMCAGDGDRAEGESCVYRQFFPYGSTCAPGMICFLEEGCLQPCDASHSCKATQQCIDIEVDGMIPAFGVCYPPLSPCQPNPCFAPNRSVCSVVAGAPQCGCDPGYQEAGGQCVKTCTPDCANKQCGPDGCGGSCGSCSSGQSCTPAGTCCSPSCAGKACGPDGCGGSCGSCSGNATCTSEGACLCSPSCAGKVCGPDGCGGSCGSCAAGASCSYGTCVTPPAITGLQIDPTALRDVTSYGSVRVTDADGLANLRLELSFSGPASLSTTVYVSGMSSSTTAADVSFSFALPEQAPTGSYTLTVQAVDGDGNKSNSLSASFKLF